MKKSISCIITTKNEGKVVRAFLSSIKTQNYKNFEIILVDNNSTDETVKTAKTFGAKIFTYGPERSAQRNLGAKKAQGKYVLILDADMILTKNVLAECVEKLEKDNNLGALVIPEKSFGKGFWAKCRVFEREFYVGEPAIEAARCFRKNIFLKFGGYDEKITGPEDWDLPLRMRKAGIKIGRIKSVIRHNEGRFSPFKSARKKFYYASHSGVFLKRHPEQIFTKGNLIFRPVFFKKWKKMAGSPILTIGMFTVKLIEAIAAMSGVVYSFCLKRRKL